MKPSSLLLTLLIPLSFSALAVDTPGHTRSAGKLLNDDSIQLQQKLRNSPLVESSSTARPNDSELNNSSGTEQQARLASHPEPTHFEIFDAWVELSGDQDYDGYYHRLNVNFDADTDSDIETVYARLYISYEGGPWYQYTSTDLFEIYGHSTDDSYQVSTELVDGYAPGYYQVLVELHSLYHHGIVASRIISEDEVGNAIALEDLDHDSPYIEEYAEYSYSHGAVGSMSWPGLLLLGFIVLIKLRYFRREYAVIASTTVAQKYRL